MIPSSEISSRGLRRSDPRYVGLSVRVAGQGTYRLDSDYDILVVVERKAPSVLDVLYESVMDVLLAHGRLVSLKVFEEGEFSRLQDLQTPFMKDLVLYGQRIG